MFMNKSGTPKKKKGRPSIKVTAQNSEYIQQWIGKDQSISDWVNKAVEFKLLDNEMQKKAEAYDRMKESGTFQHNEKLKQDVDELKRNTNRLENKVNVLEKDKALTNKMLVKIHEMNLASSEANYKRLYALDKKAAKRIFKK